MNIVDTSLWLEFFAGNQLDEAIINALTHNDELYVPVICLYEVRKKFLIENDVARADTAVRYDAVVYTQDRHFENMTRVHYFAK